MHLISYLLLPSALQWTVWFAVAVAGGLLVVVIILVFWFIVRKTEETTPGKLLAEYVYLTRESVWLYENNIL